MSDLKEFAEKLNEQKPLDLDKLGEAFDTIFYKEPEGKDPVEAKHVDGVVIQSPENAEDLVSKLQMAKKTDPRFIRIGETEYMFESSNSISRLIDGIKLGRNENL